MSKYSENPADYIFCIVKMDFLEWCAAICPADYFEREGCLCDQHYPGLDIPGWGAEMEGIFSGPANMIPGELHADLLSKGLVYSPEFADFMACHDTQDVYMPPIEVKISQEEIEGMPWVHVLPRSNNKLNTAALKQFCANYFRDNPGVLIREYDPKDAEEMKLAELEVYLSSPKAWKRAEKHKEGDQWFRAFWVKDFSVLEAHGYSDDDAIKMYIYTDLTDSRIIEFSLECT